MLMIRLGGVGLAAWEKLSSQGSASTPAPARKTFRREGGLDGIFMVTNKCMIADDLASRINIRGAGTFRYV